MTAIELCDKEYKNYQNEITKLIEAKTVYFDTMNKAIECFLTQRLGIRNEKTHNELENRKNIVRNKKLDYKKQIENVEISRVNYVVFQGNIFSSEEELERDCTNNLKIYFKKFIGILQDIFKNINLSSDNLKIIEEISGEKDNKSFAEKNKSLHNPPQRKLFEEYTLDLNYYCQNFDIVKYRLKGKNEQEIREIKKMIAKEVNEFLGNLTKEEPDGIRQRIEEIAKNIIKNKLTREEYNYLDIKFQRRYEQFKKWKEEKVGDADYKKVGKEWDDRFCYMYTFLEYFNKTIKGEKN